MTDLQEKAMRMALEALEWYVKEDDVIESMAGNEPWVEGKRKAEKAIEALRQALAQPEHEREWIDLDEEEQKECWDEGGSQRAIYQNIASKLKEKNT